MAKPGPKELNLIAQREQSAKAPSPAAKARAVKKLVDKMPAIEVGTAVHKAILGGASVEQAIATVAQSHIPTPAAPASAKPKETTTMQTQTGTEGAKPPKKAPAKSKAKKVKKAKTAKPAKKVAKPAAAGDRARYDWNGATEAAAKGTMPKLPDFSAPTHDRFRKLIAEVVEAAKAKDSAALKKIEITTTSSTPKALARYRNLCVEAIKNAG